jgi:hypothetical protein
MQRHSQRRQDPVGQSFWALRRTDSKLSEGRAAATVEFDGAQNDPALPDAISQFGQQQDNAIKKDLLG